jgi:CBS domain-containing protein
MSRPVVTIDADATIREAAELMRTAGVGCLPVVTLNRLAGAVTDRDLIVRCLATGLPDTTPVRHAMTAYAVTCFADETLEQAVEQMIRCGVRRLIVLDIDQDVVGMLSLDDLAVVQPDGALAGAVLARTVEQRGVWLDDATR